MKKTILLFLFVILAISFSGCNTLKGASEGFGRDRDATREVAKRTWENAKGLDAWLQEHAW